VLAIHALLLYVVYRAAQGAPPPRTAASISENIGSGAAVLATIPAGFLVYQLYYFNYGPIIRFPFRRGGRTLVRSDRGQQVLSHFSHEQLDKLRAFFVVQLDVDPAHSFVERPPGLLRHPSDAVLYCLGMLELDDTWRPDVVAPAERETKYTERWGENWDVLRAIVHIAASNDQAMAVKHEYTALSDLYHALGAARTAVSLAWAAVAALALTHPARISGHPTGTAIGFAISSLLTLALWVVLHKARRQTWQTAAASLRYGLQWLFTRDPDPFMAQAPSAPDEDSPRKSARFARTGGGSS
jgi:hypothetical protein